MRSIFTPDQRRKWLNLIREIKQLFPKYKITIRRVKIKPLGLILVNDRHVLIKINQKLDFSLSFYTLMEELAHLQRGITNSYQKDHDDQWGILYSRNIRQFIKFLE